MTFARKAVVISNCQSQPLAAFLTLLSLETSFEPWGVHLVRPDQRSSVVQEFVARARKDYDLILSIPLGEDFGPLSQTELTTTFDVPVIRISNVYFSGLHPDLCYVGGLGRRLAGPLGDYHSKICLFAFLRGLTPEVALNLFEGETYGLLQYYAEYDRSLSEMIQRDASVDIPISSLLPDLLRTILCFFFVNHPTPALFAAYCNLISRRLQEHGWDRGSGMPADANMSPETLASNCIFPVYREIASYHNIGSFGSYTFKPVGRNVNPLSLARFVEEEYAAFRSVGLDDLVATNTARTISAEFRNVGLSSHS